MIISDLIYGRNVPWRKRSKYDENELQDELDASANYVCGGYVLISGAALVELSDPA